MSDNTFDRILGRLDDSEGVSEKTASVATTPTAEATMLASVRRISESAVKTAAAAEETPAANLVSMAKNAAAHEDELLTKQAEQMGATICDGFFARYAAYDTALAGQPKTAAVATLPSNSDADLQTAYAQGMKVATEQLEKQAQESFDTGYQETMQAVYKTAAEIHYQGQSVARQLLNEAK